MTVTSIIPRRGARARLVAHLDQPGSLLHRSLATDISRRIEGLDQALGLLPMLVSVKDRQLRYRFANRHWLDYAGLARDAVIGRHHHELPLAGRDRRSQDPAGPDDPGSDGSGQNADSIRRDMQVIATGKAVTDAVEIFCDRDGRERSLITYKVALLNRRGQPSGVLSVAFDLAGQGWPTAIGERTRLDPVTGLITKSVLIDRLAEACTAADQGGPPLAVLSVDLDRFRLIEGGLGRERGDAVLRAVARRLAALVRPQDLLGRLGGDEFLIVAPGLSTGDQAAELADTVLNALRAPIAVDGHTLFLRASAGISRYPADAGTLSLLLRHAEIAMHVAKARGGNGFRVFTPEMNPQAQTRLRIAQDLQDALTHQQFELCYQPKIRADTQRVVGLEALLRWQHPRIGPIPPDLFIPIAEETGMILPIGARVIDMACAQLAIWRSQGSRLLPVALNISARQLQQDSFADDLIATLAGFDLPPGLITLEVSETGLLQQIERVEPMLHRLREAGVGISLDDFGTGYSSVAQLARLGLDTLKIDRSVIQDSATDPVAATMTGTIIAMARRLGVKTVAKGVETARQVAFLNQSGCDEFQGYLFGRPAAADQILARYLHPGPAAAGSEEPLCRQVRIGH